MNVEIERINISLQDVPAALGDGVARQLDSVIRRTLSEMKLRTAGSGIGDLDLGVIDAPANADSHTITELIAARLVEWISREAEPARPAATAPAAGATGEGS